MTAVAVSPDLDCEDTLVATASVKGTIRLWTLSGSMVASIPCHKYGPYGPIGFFGWKNSPIIVPLG